MLIIFIHVWTRLSTHAAILVNLASRSARQQSLDYTGYNLTTIFFDKCPYFQRVSVCFFAVNSTLKTEIKTLKLCISFSRVNFPRRSTLRLKFVQQRGKILIVFRSQSSELNLCQMISGRVHQNNNRDKRVIHSFIWNINDTTKA